MSWGLCGIACSFSVVPFFAKLTFAQQHSMPHASCFVLGPYEWFETCKPEISWGWVSTLFWTIDFPTNFFLGGVLRKCGREQEGATSGVGFNWSCRRDRDWKQGHGHQPLATDTYEHMNPWFAMWPGQPNLNSKMWTWHRNEASAAQVNNTQHPKTSIWAGLTLYPLQIMGTTRNTHARCFGNLEGKLRPNRSQPHSHRLCALHMARLAAWPGKAQRCTWRGSWLYRSCRWHDWNSQVL